MALTDNQQARIIEAIKERIAKVKADTPHGNPLLPPDQQTKYMMMWTAEIVLYECLRWVERGNADDE